VSAKAAVGGALRDDSYMIAVGDGRQLATIGGALKGDKLVIHERTTTIGGATGPEVIEVLKVGSNTIGGSFENELPPG
jgi:hypothetical protein